MHITFISECPMDQKKEFSGIPYYMGREIQAQADGFEFILTPKYNLDVVLHGEIQQARDEFIKSGKFISEQLMKLQTDVVICLTGSMIPYMQTDKPVVLWHDSIWYALHRPNMDFTTFKAKYPLLYELDQLTLDKCALVVFAAEWVREEVLNNYHISPEKVYTIPFGANIEPASSRNVGKIIAKRGKNSCILSFFGIEWERKGLPLAVEVTTRLNSLGVNTILNVMGCSPNKPSLRRRIANKIHYRPYTNTENFEILFHKTKNINKIGFLDKNDSAQYERIEETLLRTHFLLHPAIFECFGIVMAEANALGVPVLATDQYGPRTVVRNGINGQLFNRDEYVDKATAFIMDQMQNYDHYIHLAQSSYSEFLDRLNWQTSVRKLKSIIQEKVLAV